MLGRVDLLEVDSDDLVARSLGENETRGHGVNDVDLLGSLEDGKAGRALLKCQLYFIIVSQWADSHQ